MIPIDKQRQLDRFDWFAFFESRLLSFWFNKTLFQWQFEILRLVPFLLAVLPLQVHLILQIKFFQMFLLLFYFFSIFQLNQPLLILINNFVLCLDLFLFEFLNNAQYLLFTLPHKTVLNSVHGHHVRIPKNVHKCLLKIIQVIQCEDHPSQPEILSALIAILLVQFCLNLFGHHKLHSFQSWAIIR